MCEDETTLCNIKNKRATFDYELIDTYTQVLY